MLSSQYLSKNARFYNLHTCAPHGYPFCISTINHSYWSYKPTPLSFGGPTLWMDGYPSVVMAGWESPETNGGFHGNIEINGPWLPVMFDHRRV